MQYPSDLANWNCWKELAPTRDSRDLNSNLNACGRLPQWDLITAGRPAVETLECDPHLDVGRYRLPFYHGRIESP